MELGSFCHRWDHSRIEKSIRLWTSKRVGCFLGGICSDNAPLNGNDRTLLAVWTSEKEAQQARQWFKKRLMDDGVVCMCVCVCVCDCFWVAGLVV